MFVGKRMAICSILLWLLLTGFSACAAEGTFSTASNAKGIPIVAAENFYGNIIQQLGGKYVSVTSLLNNPNVDPHQYESSIQSAVEVSAAKIVIENGGGYDTWMDKLLAAAPSSNRIVLTGYNIATHRLPNNPHVWYGLNNIQEIAQAMTNALSKVDAKDSAYFVQNLQRFTQSLSAVTQKMGQIKRKFGGTPVGLTETIYLYQALPMGLHVLTPFAFQKAIAEGNDPPAASVVAANNEVSQRQIKVLIYNQQTVTPITTNLLNAARIEHIPIVPVTETMPPGKTYQQWMLAQLTQLEQALSIAK